MRGNVNRLAGLTMVVLFATPVAFSANIGHVVDPGADIDELFDIFWFDRLESQGHTLTPIGADEPAEDFPDIELFIISNDVSSGEVVNGFGVEDPRPMITSGEWGLNDEWGLADVQGENTDAMTITIQDPTHPLAAGLSGDVDVFTDFQPVSTILGELAPDLQVIATVDNGFEDVPAIAVLEEGAEPSFTGLVDPSPGLRVFLFSRTHPEGGDLYNDNGLAILDAAIDFALGLTGGGAPQLQAGDSDQDLDFDQLDLVLVQIAAKYLTGQAATWGEGDWDGAPGGSQGSPPPGNGQFDQLDIIAALGNGFYLTGPYAAIRTKGAPGDAQTSVGYNAITGEVWVDAPAGSALTSINIDSASGIFTGDPAENLEGSFDTSSELNIFKATFGTSFGSLSFGNVAQPGLAEDFVANDLSVVGSLDGGGGLGDVDLIYIPEPSALTLALLGLAAVAGRFVGGRRRRQI